MPHDGSPASCTPPLALCAAIRAHGLIRIREGEFQATRRRPGTIPAGWGPIAPSLLRSSDEQTVASVSAAFRAMESWEEPGPEEFAGWGVIAASRYLGRSHLVVDLKRFFAEGVWGVSPHIIPHFALHSAAGTLSQALNLHGPNLGVGGGPDAAYQGFLTAFTWLETMPIPGVWLVLSGWAPELVPDTNGRPIGDSECVGLALALVRPEGADPDRPRLRLISGTHGDGAEPADLTGFAQSLDFLISDPDSRPRTVAADASGRSRIELVAASGAR